MRRCGFARILSATQEINQKQKAKNKEQR